MAKLQISSVYMRNFRSYGDYDTEVSLDSLGPTLILGEVADNPKKSNGAGKSSIADAIIWSLFGRLPYKQRPASHVVNNTTGKNCEVRLTTKDGHIITRTRNKKGHSDLLITQPDGKDISDSTNINAQQHLNRLFSLDYEVFTASVFFAQFGQPFLELPDVRRKKALERMLHLNRFDHYAEVAKEKITKLTTDQAQSTGEYDSLEQEILRVTRSIEQNIDLFNEYEVNRVKRVAEQEERFPEIDAEFAQKTIQLREQVAEAKAALDLIKTYDIDKLTRDWERHQQLCDKLTQAENRLQNIANEITRLEVQKDSLATTESADTDKDPNKLAEQLAEAQDGLGQCPNPDLDKLEKAWDKCNSITELLEKAEQSEQALRVKIAEITPKIEAEQQQIDEWNNRSGGVCPSCKQEITSEHALEMCAPSQDNLTKLRTRSNKLQGDLSQITDTKKKLKARLARLQPAETLETAKTQVKARELQESKITLLEQSIRDMKQQQEDDEKREREREQQVAEIDAEISRKQAYIVRRTTELEEARKKLDESAPEVTVREAEATKAQYDAQSQEISTLEKTLTDCTGQKEKAKEDVREEIKRIRGEANPYQKVIDNEKKSLEETKKKRAEAKKKVDQYNTLIRHIDYIRSAYSDRRKVKAHLLGRLIPFFNERVAYYLDVMECNCLLQFTSALQIKYDLWPYEMWSGGERKKIDLAMMFAIHDLHVSIYDQQCNIVVFDEVDGRLDQDGIDRFLGILFDELAAGDPQRSILVMSHKDVMRDAFASKIIVRKDKASEDGCSRIEEVR